MGSIQQARERAEKTPMKRLGNQSVLLGEAGLVLHDGQKNNGFMVQGEEDPPTQ